MGVFDEDIRTAEELITENGELVQLKVLTATEGAEPWSTGVPVESIINQPMVFLNFPSMGNSGSSGERYFEGSLIVTGDKKVLMVGSANVELSLNALITRGDGSVWKVVQFKLLDPNGQKILYTLQVRK